MKSEASDLCLILEGYEDNMKKALTQIYSLWIYTQCQVSVSHEEKNPMDAPKFLAHIHSQHMVFAYPQNKLSLYNFHVCTARSNFVQCGFGFSGKR